MKEQEPSLESRGNARAENTDPEEESGSITNGAEAVARTLKNVGVEHLFGIQGGAIMPVYDAIGQTDLSHIPMVHEQGAAHAADAYGVISGSPGVCMATSGPGATNLVTGLADANMDSDPVVALTGQVPTNLIGDDAFQETDTVGMTSPITKAAYFASNPDSVGETVSEAFAVSETGRPGPSIVDLPKDVTKMSTTKAPSEPKLPVGYNPPREADQETVAAAADCLEAAKRPIVLAGGGVIRGDAADELRRFAINYDVPVVTTMPGVGAFPEDHELALGMAGMHGTGSANLAISHCDAMLAVGTRFADRLTGGIESFAPEASIVHVDIDPAEISKNIEADHGLIGDAGTVLAQLDNAMSGSPRTKKWRARCMSWKSEYPMGYGAPRDEPLKPQFVVEALDEATPDDAIVTTGVGQHQMWAVLYWTFTEANTWISSHGLGAMGYGLPAAIGADLASDDETEVVCIEGDASFLMTMQELSVAVREKLDITIAVLNNEYIGMVRQWQDVFHDSRHTASEYSWMPEFDKLAEAYGARGYRVEEYDEVAETIEDAREYNGPSVIDFHIDPSENVYPMVPPDGENYNFALSINQV
jgi:acetolactate synthase-1/2/3 large subunit